MTPIDTMMPVTPARVRARPEVFESTEMHGPQQAAAQAQPGHDHEASVR